MTMTVLNGHRPATKTHTTNGKSIVVYIKKSKKVEHRALGYLYAGFKLPGEETISRGFIFKKNSYLPIDNGFEFDEKELLEYDASLKQSKLKACFYPAVPEVPPVAANRLQEEGIYPDTDRIQDIPTPARQTMPAPLLPTIGMSFEQLLEFLTPEDEADLKRQLAYTLAAAKAMGVSQAAAWQQATSLAGVHFIPQFDPRYKESFR